MSCHSFFDTNNLSSLASLITSEACCIELRSRVLTFSREDMERIIEDGIARDYPGEIDGDRVTMAQLLSDPVSAAYGTPIQAMGELDTM